MDILVLETQGDETALLLCKDLVAGAWNSTRVVGFQTKKNGSRSSFVRRPETFADRKTESIDGSTWKRDMTPCEIIESAVCDPSPYTNAKGFELVVTGIEKGPVLGQDLLTSGAVAACLTATSFGIAALAYFQEPEENGELDLTKAKKVLPGFIRQFRAQLMPGCCYVVNVPKGDLKVFREVPPAHYSHWNTPDPKILPRAQRETSDITAFKAGHVTVAEVQMRLEAARRY